MISIQDAKNHVGQEGDHDDALIAGMIDAAGEIIAQYTGRVWTDATQVQLFDGFSDRMVLKYAPFVSLTSVKYLDSDGIEQTLASTFYKVDSRAELAVVNRAWGESWPNTQNGDQQTVTITYIAGYTEGDSPNPVPLPDPLRIAALMIFGALYEQRENQAATKLEEPPVSAKYLMLPYKILS